MVKKCQNKEEQEKEDAKDEKALWKPKEKENFADLKLLKSAEDAVKSKFKI